MIFSLHIFLMKAILSILILKNNQSISSHVKLNSIFKAKKEFTHYQPEKKVAQELFSEAAAVTIFQLVIQPLLIETTQNK